MWENGVLRHVRKLVKIITENFQKRRALLIFQTSTLLKRLR